MTRAPGTAGAARLGLLGLLLACACSTSLLETGASFSQGALARLRRGGTSSGCHERASELFDVFLICPGPKQALGIAHAEGKLLISCPELGRRACRKFFERLRGAGGATAVNGGSER